jgi:hypothetical protein
MDAERQHRKSLDRWEPRCRIEAEAAVGERVAALPQRTTSRRPAPTRSALSSLPLRDQRDSASVAHDVPLMRCGRGADANASAGRCPVVWDASRRITSETALTRARLRPGHRRRGASAMVVEAESDPRVAQRVDACSLGHGAEVLTHAPARRPARWPAAGRVEASRLLRSSVRDRVSRRASPMVRWWRRPAAAALESRWSVHARAELVVSGQPGAEHGVGRRRGVPSGRASLRSPGRARG